MWQRARQFFSACRAEISPGDMDFIAKHLNTKEAILFWGMNLPDQRHALDVAYTAITIATGKSGINKDALYKAALLHDVGRTKNDLSTMDKVFAVLFAKYAPLKARRWGRFGRGGRLDNLRHAMFIYYHHPAIGASFLQKCGAEQIVIDLVARHHLDETMDDSPELIILRQADRLN